MRVWLFVFLFSLGIVCQCVHSESLIHFYDVSFSLNREKYKQWNCTNVFYYHLNYYYYYICMRPYVWILFPSANTLCQFNPNRCCEECFGKEKIYSLCVLDCVFSLSFIVSASNCLNNTTFRCKRIEIWKFEMEKNFRFFSSFLSTDTHGFRSLLSLIARSWYLSTTAVFTQFLKYTEIWTVHQRWKIEISVFRIRVYALYHELICYFLRAFETQPKINNSYL